MHQLVPADMQVQPNFSSSLTDQWFRVWVTLSPIPNPRHCDPYDFEFLRTIRSGRIYIYIYTHTHARTHAHTHTRTHAHTPIARYLDGFLESGCTVMSSKFGVHKTLSNSRFFSACGVLCGDTLRKLSALEYIGFACRTRRRLYQCSARLKTYGITWTLPKSRPTERSEVLAWPSSVTWVPYK